MKKDTQYQVKSGEKDEERTKKPRQRNETRSLANQQKRVEDRLDHFKKTYESVSKSLIVNCK